MHSGETFREDILESLKSRFEGLVEINRLLLLPYELRMGQVVGLLLYTRHEAREKIPKLCG